MHSVVVVPTYQEAENIVAFLTAVREAMPNSGILVVDDDSPDGTGELADKVAADLADVHVLHREAKLGLGSAYRHGFGEVLSQVIEHHLKLAASEYRHQFGESGAPAGGAHHPLTVSASGPSADAGRCRSYRCRGSSRRACA